MMFRKRLVMALLALAIAAAAGAPTQARVRTGVGEAQPGDTVYSSSSEDLASDELQVTLRPGHGERFLKIVDKVMGTETAKNLGHDKFVIRRGPGGSRDDFAAFFAAMPYVKDVKPKPKRRPAEQVPRGKFKVSPPKGAAGPPAKPAYGSPPEIGEPEGQDSARTDSGRSYVPGEILVKFKRGTSQTAINRFVAENGTKILSHLDLGEDRIYKLEVPEGVEVPDLASELSRSPIVEYAEPNYKMSIPPLPGVQPAKPANPRTPTAPRAPAALPVIRMSTEDVLGDSVFVTFRPGVRDPMPELLAEVFGVELQEEDNGRVRYSLPEGVNSLTAARLFKLCPYVMAAEPSYMR